MKARHLKTMGEHLDRVMTCDLRARPFLLPIYNAALAHQGGPLSLAAAEGLLNAIEGESHPVVIFVTGFASVTLGGGEQDGPVGAACLARTLAALGVMPVFVTDEHQIELVTQAVRGVGLNVIDPDRALGAVRTRNSVSTVIGWPDDKEAAE